LSEERAPISAPTYFGFSRISLNLGPKISHTLLGIIENPAVSTGAEFVFFVNTHFKLLGENQLEIPENQAVQNHLFTLHTVRPEL
jgi:hypothetical protein